MKKLLELLSIRVYLISHLNILIKDYFDVRNENSGVDQNQDHLQAVFDWLCRAQDANKDGGVAGRYRLDTGWTTSYPETTGYIIPTFFEYYHLTKNSQYRNRALQMADWLVSIQMSNGAFQGGYIDVAPQPIIFNTGQILKGLVRSYQETSDKQYLDAARRAGNWLIEMQDPDGAWRRCTYHNTPTVYHTTAAWPLLMLHEVISESRYLECALKHFDWACSHQQKNGWFSRCAFDEQSDAYTHTIAYTVRGLLEAGLFLNNEKYLNAAILVAEALLKRFEITKFLAAQYNEQWKSVTKFSCLTGNAQMAIIWLKLFDRTGDARYLNGALKINDYVKSTHDIHSRNPGIRGGIKGSQPIWGKYIRYGYPNWAAKYFADALMLEDQMMQCLKKRMEK